MHIDYSGLNVFVVLVLGQHLLSAIFDRNKVETLAWWLGTDVSYIEIDSKVTLTQEQIDDVENVCNAAIAAATPVTVHVLHEQDQKDVPPEVKPPIHPFLFYKKFSLEIHSTRLRAPQKAYRKITLVTFV